MTEKLTGLDFFDVSRIAAETGRRVRHKQAGGETWYKFVSQHSCLMLVSDEGKKWWPDVIAQKEKAWEVEPEKPKEFFMWRARKENGEYYFRKDRYSIEHKHWESAQKYRLVPADQPTAEIEGGLSRVRWAEGLILQLPKTHQGRNSWLLNFGVKEEAVDFRRTHVDKLKTLGYEIEELIWSEKTQSLLRVGEKSSTPADQPTAEKMKEKVQEVESEKTKEVIVYGVYNSGSHPSNGINYLYQEFPEKDKNGWYSDYGCMEVYPDQNFPKTKPQKYRLVPADQPLWPWEKFVAAEMPEEEFKFLALMEDGEILTDRWCLYNSGWATISSKDKQIEYYCRVSKIPIPEQK